MTTVEKLVIRGVRAFAPEQPESITFGVPLTLIVGHNGAGKTTIIEALKYVTTGLLPPNTTASDYLHDPELCGEKDVTAQIQVLLRSSNGSKITGTRVISCTTQRGKLVLSTNGSQSIRESRGGEDVSRSLTKGAMGSQMCRWLGVTPAVLNLVLFCHQEDSLWPMNKAADVKKHFDALFEIEKYADAIRQLNTSRNKQREKLAMHQSDVKHEKNHKEQGRVIEKECDNLSKIIASLKKEILDLDDQIKEAKDKMDAAFDRKNKAGSIVGELRGKRIEAAAKQQTVENLSRNLEELAEEDDVLENRLAQYEQLADADKQSVHTSREHIKVLQHQIEEARTRLEGGVKELGAREIQQANYEKQLEVRKQLVRDVAQRHQIRGFSGDINNDQMQLFMQRITRLADEQTAAVEAAKSEARDELQRIQKLINTAHEKYTALIARKDNARQQVENNDRNIDKYQREYDSIDIDEGGKVTLQTSLQNVQARLHTAKTTSREADWSTIEKRTEVELNTLQTTKQTLEDELRKATDNLQDTTGLEIVQNDLQERQQRLETMLGAHKSKINDVVGESWDASNVKARYEDKMDKVSRSLTESETQRDTVSRELDRTDIQLEKCRSEIQAQEDSIKTTATTIKTAMLSEPKDYQTNLTQLEDYRSDIKTESDSAEIMLAFLAQCIRDAEVHHVCRTCTRALPSNQGVAVLKANIEQQQLKYRPEEIARSLANADEQIAKAKAVGPQFELWERLSKVELPALKNELGKLELQRDDVLRRLEQQDNLVSDKASSKRDVEAIGRTVGTIATLHGEVIGCQKRIAELSAKLETAGMSRDLKSIRNDQDHVNMQEKSTLAALKKIRTEKEAADKAITTLELEVRDVQKVFDAAGHQLAEKIARAKQIEELKASNLSHKTIIRECDQSLEVSNSKQKQAQEEFDDVEMCASTREQQLRLDASKVNRSLSEMKLANQEIQAYLDRNGSQKLEDAKKAVQQTGDEIKVLSGEEQTVLKKVAQIEDRLRDYDKTRRTLDENIMYRKETRALERIQQELQELEDRDAEAEMEQFDEEGERLRLEHVDLNLKHTKKLGAVLGKDDMLKDKLEKYNLIYKDAARKYRTAHVNYETTKACMGDLDQYAKALDKAIMKFHAIKMEEINRTIDELWRKTYQGTDVDTISILSDSNGLGNKNHNYRLCMRKESTWMDMRGRCSAGQKVLACIIVRLALAECFGSNCGVIALDEPTTNLDRENIQALALALAELIRVRRAQKNFQLIIITHDEEFLKYMNPSDYVDYYYRITRNNKQKSQIRQEQISYLMRY